jgi:hypothetical protein
MEAHNLSQKELHGVKPECRAGLVWNILVNHVRLKLMASLEGRGCEMKGPQSPQNK